jgi:glutamate racemase
MIGIFDSGSGGLTVLREIRKRAPHADIVYFGDLKNAPYGNKSREELGALTVLGIQKLIDAGAHEIVSACNSVSVSIVLPMFEILELPTANIIEMVGPTVHSFKGKTATVLVLATRATVESNVYQEGFHMLGIEAHGVALPELVRQIEAGAPPETLATTIRETLAHHPRRDYTHIVLGCTHYPLVRDVFENVLRELGFVADVVDPAVPVAEAVTERFDIKGAGAITFLTSKQSDVFDRFTREFRTVVAPREEA